MKTDRHHVMETVDFLRPHLKNPPLIGVLTGTGLSSTLDSLDTLAGFKYSDLPNFPVSTVESHKGSLLYGRMADKHLLMMQGRFHLYEGYSPEAVCFPIRVMQALGVKTLILTNAAGGINLDFFAGSLMIIRDHMNLTGKNPLTGPNEDAWGIRFPDMSQVYDPALIRLAQKVALDDKIPIHTGIYAGLLGPSLETPAETRFLKTIGADAVGFSTVMEAIAGIHAGMKILGISLITNMNDPDAPVSTTLESVLKTAAKASEKMARILKGIIAQMGD